MADFEGLIRQALARQGDSDPAVRQRVYQSSRNALARMIASAGAQPPAVINEQRIALENSISRIEAGYNIPPPPPAVIRAPRPAPAAPPAPPLPPKPASGHVRHEPVLVPPPPGEEPYEESRYDTSHDDFEYVPEGVPGDDDFGVSPENGPVYQRRNGSLRRILPVLLLLLLLAGAAWLTYSMVSTLMGNGGGTAGESDAAPSGTNGSAVTDENVVYITVLTPKDTSALQLEGRGTAEIVNQANTEMIRLTSVRPAGNRSQQADPILINLSDGVLSQVAGRDVTVEIKAKSGGAEPATFSIRCDFAGEEACGRKRFPAGLQPETIIFTVGFPENPQPGAKYSLLINTDVAATSDQSAEGDPIDIISARLRFEK